MKIFISRLGGIGDCIIVTPLIRYLKQRGDEVYMLTSEQGMEIFKNNPHITKLHLHEKDSIPNKVLDDYFESIRQAWECDKHIGLSESIEVNVALYPSSPRYKYPLYERKELCDKNYYEATFVFANLKNTDEEDITLHANHVKFWANGKYAGFYRPEMFFDDAEQREMAKFFSHHLGKFVVIWVLSGSQRSKTYPYYAQVINKILQTYKDVVVITVGDEKCQILEQPFNDKRVIKKSGIWAVRESILACKHASLVISPDTGILHGAGCFDTPKIGLLTHTSVENITKHFKNDYSIECDHQLITCSPCYQLHYISKVDCQLADDGYTPICMDMGIPPEKIMERIANVRN